MPDWQDQVAGHVLVHQLDMLVVTVPTIPTASDIAVKAVQEPEGSNAFFPPIHPESTLPQSDPPKALIRVYIAPLAFTVAYAVTTPYSAGNECGAIQEIVFPANGASTADRPEPTVRRHTPDWQELGAIKVLNMLPNKNRDGSRYNSLFRHRMRPHKSKIMILNQTSGL